MLALLFLLPLNMEPRKPPGKITPNIWYSLSLSSSTLSLFFLSPGLWCRGITPYTLSLSASLSSFFLLSGLSPPGGPGPRPPSPCLVGGRGLVESVVGAVPRGCFNVWRLLGAHPRPCTLTYHQASSPRPLRQGPWYLHRVASPRSDQRLATSFFCVLNNRS